MFRSDERLLKINGRSKKSIEAELEFYQFKGGKTKSVRNRITRLEEVIEKGKEALKDD